MEYQKSGSQFKRAKVRYTAGVEEGYGQCPWYYTLSNASISKTTEHAIWPFGHGPNNLYKNMTTMRNVKTIFICKNHFILFVSGVFGQSIQLREKGKEQNIRIMRVHDIKYNINQTNNNIFEVGRTQNISQFGSLFRTLNTLTYLYNI